MAEVPAHLRVLESALSALKDDYLGPLQQALLGESIRARRGSVLPDYTPTSTATLEPPPPSNKIETRDASRLVGDYLGLEPLEGSQTWLATAAEGALRGSGLERLYLPGTQGRPVFEDGKWKVRGTHTALKTGGAGALVGAGAALAGRAYGERDMSGTAGEFTPAHPQYLERGPGGVEAIVGLEEGKRERVRNRMLRYLLSRDGRDAVESLLPESSTGMYGEVEDLRVGELSRLLGEDELSRILEIEGFRARGMPNRPPREES